MRAQATTTIDAIDPKKLLKVLSDYRRGDFSVRLPVDQVGTAGKIYDTLNDVIELNQRMAKEFARISNVVGKGGNIKQRAALPSATGDWQGGIESVNALVTDLVQPTTEVARVLGAVAKGDLAQSMALEIDDRPLTGEFLRTARVVNTMVDQLSTFAAEVRRVAVEVGTDGQLGGQASVKGVSGVWKDLTENVNSMANNLTNQVRNIAAVTTAVANGDLSKKITVDVRGEVLELKNTINTMVDQLGTFRIVQVLVNLLSNAVKFSPPGGVVIIAVRRGEGWVEFRVTDRGRGVPAAHRRAIFERFRQVEMSDSRDKGGTGLGLAICRSIVEQHGGAIGVESDEGRGSSFWFRVPRSSTLVAAAGGAETVSVPR